MKKAFVLVAAMVMVVMAGPAMAATATSVFNVSANVLPTCSITTAASNIAFGNYDPTSATPLDGSGAVEFRCTRNTLYWTYIPGPWTIAGPAADVLTVGFYTDGTYATGFEQGKVGGGTA
jgi:spore coat protein U-like protein